MKTDYSIWALEYCHVPEQPTEYIWNGLYRKGETVDFPFATILIEGGGKKICVECGIDFDDPVTKAMAEMYLVKDLHQLPDLLNEIGWDAADVDYVIPTHGHWDHIGGINFFPNAKIILQEEDIFGWLRCMAKPDRFAGCRGPIRMPHFHHILDAIEDGRVIFLNGPVKNILPGIDIEVDYEGHSFASQLVIVHSTLEDGSDDPYMMAGDVIYSTSNVFGIDGIPGFIPCTAWNVGSTWQTLNTYERMYEFAKDDPNRLIPSHDYEYWTKWPYKTLDSGMRIAEIRLAEGVESLVK